MDREKVIEAYECCRQFNRKCKECPYEKDCYHDGMPRFGLTDAIELLKEQEAVKPKTEPSAKGYWYTCGVCGWWLFEVRDTVHFDDRKRIHFCASCGRSVKWDA